MSDGMSDAAAMGQQEQAVREAASCLAKALKEAHIGVRGWAIRGLDLVDMVNDYLNDENAPFELKLKSRR